MKEKWEMDAVHPDDYNIVEATRGREFVIRLTNGADVFLALQKFAVDHKIRFAKIHAAFMGAFQPCRFLVWTPNTAEPGNWHNESEMVIDNLSMVLALGGVLHPRPLPDGSEEIFPAIHFATGGAWNVPTIGGHLVEGTIVKGVLECFITEILDIDVMYPQDWLDGTRPDPFPESWYKSTK